MTMRRRMDALNMATERWAGDADEPTWTERVAVILVDIQRRWAIAKGERARYAQRRVESTRFPTRDDLMTWSGVPSTQWGKREHWDLHLIDKYSHIFVAKAKHLRVLELVQEAAASASIKGPRLD